MKFERAVAEGRRGGGQVLLQALGEGGDGLQGRREEVLAVGAVDQSQSAVGVDLVAEPVGLCGEDRLRPGGQAGEGE
ncbi:MAG: hypothetical protein HYU66_26445 [Armatimonadetes bacterium]|nr:hypothetical protein [Armatimonadota bacterium]